MCAEIAQLMEGAQVQTRGSIPGYVSGPSPTESDVNIYCCHDVAAAGGVAAFLVPHTLMGDSWWQIY